MAGTTSKYALPYPQPADAPNIPADIQSLATSLDAIIATAYQGVASARPSAGKAGRSYLATDTGALSFDTGSAWLALGVLNTSGVLISTVTPGESASAGTTGTAADAGHVHPSPAFSGTGDITPSAPGQSVAAGASGRFADGAHQHAREAWAASGDLTTNTPGQVAAAGSTGRTADGGHAHPMPAFGASGDIQSLAFGGTAAAGSSGKFADAGHKHAMPAAPAAGILGVCRYAPATGTGKNSGGAYVLGAFDATNLTVAFVAPASGRVVVSLSGWVIGQGSNTAGWFGLLDHTSHAQVGDAIQVKTGSITNITRSADILITGLTAGQSYQYDFAGAGDSGGVFELVLNALPAGGAIGNVNTQGGPGLMTVFAA